MISSCGIGLTMAVVVLPETAVFDLDVLVLLLFGEPLRLHKSTKDRRSQDPGFHRLSVFCCCCWGGGMVRGRGAVAQEAFWADRWAAAAARAAATTVLALT